MSSERYDIAILGGGPAGCVLALALRRLGFDVALVDRPRRFEALEGLSERAVDGLRHAGFAASLAALPEPAARQAHWNGSAFGGNRERDLVTGFTSPPRLTLGILMSFATHPDWTLNYLFRDKF